MSNQAYTFVAGDGSSTLRLTCLDDDTGNPLDLSNSTVYLRWVNSANALVERAMSLVGPGADGVVSYQFVGSELESGIMAFEARVRDAGGNDLRSLELLRERVREGLS